MVYSIYITTITSLGLYVLCSNGSKTLNSKDGGNDIRSRALREGGKSHSREEEGRQWEAAAKAREESLQRSLQIQAERLAVWDCRAKAWEVEGSRREAATRTREERLQRILRIHVERTTAWEAKEMLWRRRAEEHYLRAEGLEHVIQ